MALKRIKHLFSIFIKYFFFFLSIYIIVFLSINLIPVDPARVLLGPAAPEKEVKLLRKQMGIDKPLYIRFIRQTQNIIKLNLGESFYYRESVSHIVSREFVPSIIRSIIALILSFLLGYLLGIVYFRYSLFKISDYIYIASMIPSFLYELIALWGFPRLGFGLISSKPVYEIILIIISIFYPASYVAVTLMKTLKKQFDTQWYPLLYRLKGITLWKTIIRTSKVSVPQLTSIVVSSFGVVVTSVFFGEYIFNLEGFGTVFLSAILRKDISVVIAGTLITSFIIISLFTVNEIMIYLVFPQLNGRR